jgi:hypothetical protein
MHNQQTHTRQNNQSRGKQATGVILDVAIAAIETRFGRLAAFGAYVGAKRWFPQWSMSRLERYVLFPGSFLFELLRTQAQPNTRRANGRRPRGS